MAFDAIGIVAEDCERSIRFYRLLGVEFVRAGDSEHFEAKTSSGIRLLLDSVALIKKFEPNFKRAQGTAGLTLCFKQASRKAVDDLYTVITGEGFKSIKAPWDAFWGQRYACVLDPDGNQIDLFA